MNKENSFQKFSVVVEEGQKPLRIDKFLVETLDGIVRSKIQKASEGNLLFVNGENVKSNYKVKPGDAIEISIESQPNLLNVAAEDIPLDIIYEDEELAVINKPAGMVVHPGHGNYSGTLVNAIKHHFVNLPSMKSDTDRPGLVHRIDKDTSGLLVIAKTEASMESLNAQFKAHSVTRLYNALVWGEVEENAATIEGNIGRHLKDRLQMAVFEDGSQGKHAITHYKVLERFTYVTLVECQLETGRTHQIRAHFKHIGHPLFNDERYGGDKILKGTTFSKYKQFVENCFKVCPRQALHARSLSFDHPTTSERMHFEQELPEDILELLDKWRNYTKHSRNE